MDAGDNSGITSLYTNGSYLEKNPDWHAYRSQWKADHVLTGLNKTKLKPKSLCDIGCGTGLVLAKVAKGLNNLDKVVGFELSPNAPEHPDATDIVKFNRTDATKSSEHFDVALMMDVFEHVENYFGFLRDCKHLADNHIFHIPLDATALSVVSSGFERQRNTLGHLHYFTRKTALATLIETGYQPVYWHFTASGWDGPGRNPWTVLNITRRVFNRLNPEMMQRILGGLSLLVVTKKI